MRQNFFEKVLPTQGTYCAVAIDNGKVYPRFFNSISELDKALEESPGVNLYVSPNTFLSDDRKAKNAAYARSFFVDLDVGPNKSYPSKDAALIGLEKFIEESGLPPATILDSGTGIHAYWPFTSDIAISDWKPYAELFKKFCQQSGLLIDPACTADAARIMRCPETFNYKTDPPNKSYVMSTEIYQYSFNNFKEFLGPLQTAGDIVLAHAKKGLDDDTKAALRLDNHETIFQDIALKSLGGMPGVPGCAQIEYILKNAKDLDYGMWFAGLSIAAHSDDRDTAIHLMSEDYDGYDRVEVDKKAVETLKAGPTLCSTFDTLRPGVCEDCYYKGKINSPISLGKRIKQALSTVVATKANVPAVNGAAFPDYLKPYFRAQEGGVYYQAAVDDGEAPQAVMLVPFDFYPTKRIYSKTDGECLLMHYALPKDGDRDFLLNWQNLLSDEFAKQLMHYGVPVTKPILPRLQDYINRWGTYMIATQKAEDMRMQMGFTADRSAFVLGKTEIRNDGQLVEAPASNYMRELSDFLTPQGTYEAWRRSADYMNEPEMEFHAFGLLMGFASPLMNFTNVPGVSVLYYGNSSGSAKSGALYAGLSVFGKPTALSTFSATENAAINRMVGLHNLLLARDEIGNIDPIVASQLIHSISQGVGKLRMARTGDVEREFVANASLIGFYTANSSVLQKISTAKASTVGEDARLVEFLVERTPTLFVKSQRMAEKIFNPFKENYGHAGPRFIQEVYKIGFDGIKQRIQSWGDRFLHLFGDDSAYRFYRSLVATAFTGGEIAVEAGIIKLDLERIFNFMVSAMLSLKANVAMNDLDYNEVIDGYFRKYASNFVVMNRREPVTLPHGEFRGRIHIDTNVRVVSVDDFKKYLAPLQISLKEFIAKTTAAGIKIIAKKQRLSTGWKGGPSGSTIATLVFGYTGDINEPEPEISTDITDIKQETWR